MNGPSQLRLEIKYGLAGISFVTTLPAPITLLSPIVTPGRIVTPPANVVAAGNPCRIIKEAEEGDRYGIIDEKNGQQSIK